MHENNQRPSGLEGVISLGARRRQPFYLSLLAAAAPFIILAATSAFAIYVLTMLAAGRSDWVNILTGALAALAIPVIAFALLLAGARRTHPFTLSLAVMVFAASFSIAILSALRVPVSYLGFLLTMPSSIFFVTIGNVAMVRRLRRSVALLAFPGASAVVDAAKWKLPVIEPYEVSQQYRRILIDPVTHHSPEWSAQLAKMYLRGMEIEAWPSYLELTLGKVDLAAFDLADISYSPSQILYYRLKRALDICGVLLLALPASLLCGLIWIYIRILDGGPSMFVQERRGYAGTTFRLYKFRTMYKGPHAGSTVEGDSRVIPGCHILRQLRLDELPQLLNILRGDMSFIGPRPVSVAVAEALEARIPLYVNRQILVPGLTGWAQVSQGYAETADEEVEKLAYDLYYLKNVSLDLDIIILFRTVKTVLLRIGAR
ncbi:sugar transferase [Devosia marina]|uniref:Sugar transferase n=1 Tax=Devosia marina TaxID=2683198 RepID=A0A7X3K2H9_9HYPH|nr:sugar transferase [Devosia marina]MVS97928.1 sugar transferase [Devosia marina]